MSRIQIQKYYKKLDDLIRYGGSRNEQSTHKAFDDLLDSYCEPRNFNMVPELEYVTRFNMPRLRMPYAYLGVIGKLKMSMMIWIRK